MKHTSDCVRFMVQERYIQLGVSKTSICNSQSEKLHKEIPFELGSCKDQKGEEGGEDEEGKCILQRENIYKELRE